MTENDVFVLQKKSEGIAEDHGFLLHPDKEILELVLRGLVESKVKYGAYYCPCQIVSGNMSEIELKKLICPCHGFDDSVRQDGSCHCGLFVSKELVEDYQKEEI